MSRDERAWWMRGGRFMATEIWIESMGILPCWRHWYSRERQPIEACVEGAFNDLRERRQRVIASNRRELQRVMILGESD